MSNFVPVNLQFLANKNSKESNPEILEKASQIIKLCQLKLAKVSDPDIKSKLNNMIKITGRIVHALSKNENSERLEQQYLELQLEALQLPNEILEQPKLASLSYQIAMSCLFILALSISLSLGYVFHALIYHYFEAEVFIDTLMSALSAIGIPAVSLGVFSYALSFFTGKSSQETEVSGEFGMFYKLQVTVNEFSTLLNKEDTSSILDSPVLNSPSNNDTWRSMGSSGSLIG